MTRARSGTRLYYVHGFAILTSVVSNGKNVPNCNAAMIERKLADLVPSQEPQKADCFAKREELPYIELLQITLELTQLGTIFLAIYFINSYAELELKSEPKTKNTISRTGRNYLAA